MIEILKSILFGIVEGGTEWRPISSTGHLILLNELVRLNVSEEFRSMFDVVIQLGAILAVVVLFFHKLNPFARDKSPKQRAGTWKLWGLVVLSILPSGVVGVLFDDWMDTHLHNAWVVSLALIVYGVAFIAVERRNQGVPQRGGVPGTRGVVLLLHAIPTMLGASAIKLLKFFMSGVGFAGQEVGILLVGCLVSFLVSILVIRGLMEYVRKHSFSAFGVYRILLGAAVLLYFAFIKQ